MNNYTLTTICYEQIKKWILETEFLPGEKLKGEYLKQRLQVGLTPIREALARLASSNLVAFKDKIGFSVATLDEKNVYDTIRSYARIETLLFRESIKNGTDEWESRIVAALHKLSKVEDTSEKIPYSLWEPRNDDFHDSLVSECKYNYLLNTRNELVMLRKWYLRLFHRHINNAKLIKVSHHEHTKLAKLAISRKTDLACSYLYSHLTTDMDPLVAHLITHGIITST